MEEDKRGISVLEGKRMNHLTRSNACVRAFHFEHVKHEQRLSGGGNSLADICEESFSSRRGYL